MLAELIDKIITLKRPEIIKLHDEREMVLAGYHEARIPYPDALKIHNLTGIVDFPSIPESWGEKFVHVEDFDKVFLYLCKHGEYNQRVALVSAIARPCNFKFGQRYPLEEFIIALHGMFQDTNDSKYLFDLVGGIRVDDNTNFIDDGAGQQITAARGVSSLKEKVLIKNPVCLQPFRTFNDVRQPISEFVFRYHRDDRMGVTCSLHECDGEAWKQEAIQAIKAFFVEKLPDVPVIA